MPALIESQSFTSQGYVAPTVYLRGDRYLSNYNYYGSLQGAINKYFYIQKTGGSNTTPVGIKTFINNNTAQTLGINCDFYTLQGGNWSLTSYAWLKENIGSGSFPPCVFRFMSTDGGGPYYAIFDKYYFGLAAIAIKDVDPAKLAELDAFWREVQLMKYRYNSFVGFLNTLSQKQLNTVEQRIFNEGMLIVQNLSNQMGSIRGITILYNQSGAIGTPVLLIIALIVILSAAAAWTVSSIVSEKEKTKRINDTYDLNKWVVAKKQEVAQQVATNQISQASANSIYATLDGATAVANKIATDAAKSKSTLGEVANILKWGAVGYVAYMLLSKSKSVNNAAS